MQTTETTAAATATEVSAEKILDDLLKFVNRRTGMDVRNYAQDWRDTEGLKAFRSEYREILRDGKMGCRCFQVGTPIHRIAFVIICATAFINS